MREQSEPAQRRDAWGPPRSAHASLTATRSSAKGITARLSAEPMSPSSRSDRADVSRPHVLAPATAASRRRRRPSCSLYSTRRTESESNYEPTDPGHRPTASAISPRLEDHDAADQPATRTGRSRLRPKAAAATAEPDRPAVARSDNAPRQPRRRSDSEGAGAPAVRVKEVRRRSRARGRRGTEVGPWRERSVVVRRSGGRLRSRARLGPRGTDAALARRAGRPGGAMRNGRCEISRSGASAVCALGR